MLSSAQNLIKQHTEEGTGAAIELETENSGAQTGLKLWFSDIGRSRSPIVHLRPKGLTRFEARLTFGNFAAETITQMRAAEPEAKQLARALVKSILKTAVVSCENQSLDTWEVSGPTFSIVAEKRGVTNRFGDDALTNTCRDIVIPMLGAMAELYGYDTVIHDGPETTASEGAVKLSVIKRRERNPRNKLLCLRIHGYNCAICRIDPRAKYGSGMNIIEVHHIQPIGMLETPRVYNPETDLIPLCPNCHRAIHTRRPLPWSPEDLQEMLLDG
jgi:5-methylcytosine-specific restriction protein A